MRSFLEYISPSNPEESIDVMHIGGFVVSNNSSKFIFENFILKENEDQTVSKSVILYDFHDIAFLMQFPPRFHKAALAYRYNKMLFDAKREQEETGQIEDIKQVNINNTIFTVETGAERLLNRLEAKRDLQKLSSLTPEQKHEYKAGTLEFNLSGHKRLGDNTDVGKSYVGLTDSNAGGVLNDWRYGVATGWLGSSAGVDWKHFNYGGGKPSKQFILDWNGEQIINDKSNIKLPSMNVNTLKGLGFNLGEDPDIPGLAKVNDESGQLMWTMNKGGKIVTEIGHAPYYSPGKHIKQKDFANWKAMIAEIEMLQKQNSSNLQSVKDEAIKLLKTTKRYDEVDWLIHRYNTSVDENGKRKYPAMHTNVIRFGGTQPLRSNYMSDAGSDEMKNFITEQFLNDSKNKAVFKIGFTNGTAWTHNETVFASLMQKYDDIWNESLLKLLSQAGNPVFSEYKKSIDENQDSAIIAENKDKCWNFYKKLVNSFVSSIAQYDYGSGTRRKRQSGTGIRTQSLDASVGDTGTVGTTNNLKRREIIDQFLSRKPGERQFRPRPGLFSTMPDGSSEFASGHDLQVLKMLAQDIKISDAELKQLQQQRKSEDDSKREELIKKSIGISSTFIDTVSNIIIANNAKSGKVASDSEVTAEAAEILSSFINPSLHSDVEAGYVKSIDDVDNEDEDRVYGNPTGVNFRDPNSLIDFLNKNPDKIPAIEDHLRQHPNPALVAALVQVKNKQKSTSPIPVTVGDVTKNVPVHSGFGAFLKKRQQPPLPPQQKQA